MHNGWKYPVFHPGLTELALQAGIAGEESRAMAVRAGAVTGGLTFSLAWARGGGAKVSNQVSLTSFHQPIPGPSPLTPHPRPLSPGWGEGGGSCSQRFHGLAKIVRPWSLEAHRFTADGMLDGQSEGVQGLPGDQHTIGGVDVSCTGTLQVALTKFSDTHIQPIGDDRVPQMQHVNSELVRASGARMQFHE